MCLLCAVLLTEWRANATSGVSLCIKEYPIESLQIIQKIQITLETSKRFWDVQEVSSTF